MQRTKTVKQEAGEKLFRDPTIAFSMDMVTYDAGGIVMHQHTFTEIVVIFNGSGMHCTEHGKYPVSPGDVYIMAGERTHGFEKTVKMELANLYFFPNKLPVYTDDVRALPSFFPLFVPHAQRRGITEARERLHLSTHDLAHLRALVDSLNYEFDHKEAGYHSAIVSKLTLVIVLLCRAYEKVHRASTPATSRRLGAVIHYLNQHYHEDIALSHLARLAHLSINQFLRVFQRALDQSPMSYLSHLRVFKATELMRTRDVNVTETAHAVGFNDSHYFARTFQRVMGMPPRAYLKMLGEEKKQPSIDVVLPKAAGRV
ncbi:MAG: AraC family transcriptional regulator [bacterium]|nr:AraC family transcriptional regulator [bacterium]